MRRKVHAPSLDRNKTTHTPRLQGRETRAGLCTQEPALHPLGWEEKVILVLKIKENQNMRMGEAERHRSGVGPAVAWVWVVRGRAQRVRVVEGPTVFCAAQVMSQQLGASYRQPLLAAELAPSSSREEQSGDHFPHPKQAR